MAHNGDAQPIQQGGRERPIWSDPVACHIVAPQPELAHSGRLKARRHTHPKLTFFVEERGTLSRDGVVKAHP